MNSRITFIGSGKMSTAIASGLIKSKKYSPEQFCVSDKSEESTKYLSSKSGITNVTTDNIQATKQADVVILAVKPQNMEEVCKQVCPYCKGKLIVSIAAGIQLNTLYNLLFHKRVIRVMPNTPMMVGIGASAFSLGQDCSPNDKQICLDIFSTVGKIFEVKDEHMDAVTAVSGSGPAYVYQFIQALAEAGIKQGLEPSISFELSKQTVLGASSMVSQQLGTPEELTKAVTSPNGTTYAALQNMKKFDFYGIVEGFVAAAANRSRELGKPKL